MAAAPEERILNSATDNNRLIKAPVPTQSILLANGESLLHLRAQPPLTEHSLASSTALHDVPALSASFFLWSLLPASALSVASLDAHDSGSTWSALYAMVQTSHLACALALLLSTTSHAPLDPDDPQRRHRSARKKRRARSYRGPERRSGAPSRVQSRLSLSSGSTGPSVASARRAHKEDARGFL